MTESTERSRRLLQKLCGAGRIMGWALLALAAVGFGILVWNLEGMLGLGRRIVIREVMDITFDYLFTGVVALCVVQFIRYLVEKESQPGWFLRKGHLILCILALCLLARGALEAYPKLAVLHEHLPERLSSIDSFFALALVILIGVLPSLTKALVLIGMGLAMRLSLPVIAESKTLV